MNRLTVNHKVIIFFVLLSTITVLCYFSSLNLQPARAYKPSTVVITHEQANVIELSKEVTTEQVNTTETKLSMVVTTNDIEIAPTRFLYLTQTENCIPTYLKSPEVIGDSEACQCDVIVLSYKTKCADTSLPHVQYIFNSSKSTTWTVGRNLLYEVAKKKKEKYIHYIFMDDDAKLITLDIKNKHNPWRMYEESLKTFQPAVASVLLHNDRKFSSPKKVNCEATGYVQVYFMDAIFNSFHYQAIDHVLPYTAKYDSVSWWKSQVYLIIKCNIVFNKEVVMDPRLGIQNLKHREYPKKPGSILESIVSDIRSEVPEKYRISVEPILQQWLTNSSLKKLAGGAQTCKRDLSLHPYRPYENLT